MKNIRFWHLILFGIAAILFLELGPRYGFLPTSNTVYIANMSLSKQVALLKITADGIELNQHSQPPKQKFLSPHYDYYGDFKSMPKLNLIELWLRKGNANIKKYSCTVKSAAGGCYIRMNYLDSGIECGICSSKRDETYLD